MEFKHLSQAMDYEYVKDNLTERGLRVIEGILDAYTAEKIDIYIIRDENEQIDFARSGGLIVNDKTYQPVGCEELIIKWYEGFEDTGYMVESLSQYSKRKFKVAAWLVNDLRSENPDEKEILDIANIFSLLKYEGLLTDDEALRMTERIHDCTFTSGTPLLNAERVDAVIYLLNNGINDNRFDALPSLTQEQVKDFLLSCDEEIFVNLVELVAVDNQHYYAPEVNFYSNEIFQPLVDSISEFVVKETPSIADEDIEIESENKSEFSFVASKSVLDSDGFMTDYTWYHAPDGTSVFVFGDSDIYKPEDGYFDHVCENEHEAQEWFDCYTGFEEELEAMIEVEKPSLAAQIESATERSQTPGENQPIVEPER